MVVIEEDVKKAYQKMHEQERTSFSVDGWDLFMCSLQDASKLSLTATVYQGGNFIPKSVRENLHHKIPFFSSIKTAIALDESHFRILLHYIGEDEELTLSAFKELVQEFLEHADWWRLFLDEHDKHDLVYVRVV